MATTAIVYALIGRDRASGVFRQVGRNANRLASTSSKVGAAIKTGLAVGAISVVGLGAASLQAAGTFEKNMNRVAALSGATGKQLTRLRDQAKDLGKTTQYGAAQSADAMAQLATAGLTVNQIYGSMPSVLALASSEQLDLTRAAEITTNVLTGYGMSIKQIPHAVDAMVKASVKANTSVDDLGEAFKYSGPIAHQAGLQFEEAVAATALMGNAGIKASMAGTALRGAVTRLLSPTAKVSKTLKDLGVNVSTADGKLKPLTYIVDQLAKKGATTGDIMTIFGQRAGPGMAALIQQGSDKLAGLTKELENSGGTADKIAKIQMKGLKGEITRLKNAWEGLMIEIGDTGLLTGATKALSYVTSGVRDMAGWVNDQGIPKIKQFSSAVADMVPVDRIKSGFTTAKTLIGDFFSGLSGPKKAAALPTPMLKAPKLPDTIALPKAAAPPKSEAKLLGEQIRGAVTGGIEGINWDKVGEALGGALAKSFQWIAKNGGKLAKQLISAMAALDWVDIGKQVGGKSLGFMIGFVTSFGQELFTAEFWKKHFWDTIIAVISLIGVGKIAGPIGKFLSKIPILKMFAPLFSGLSKITAPISKIFSKIFKFVGSGLWKGLARIFPRGAAIVEREAGLITTRLGVWGLSLLEKGKGALKFLGTGFLKGATWVISKVGELIGLILKPFVMAGSWLIKKGTAFVTGFGRGALIAAKGIGGFAKRIIVDPIVGFFRSAGSWLLARGSALVTGLRDGIVTRATGIGAWAKRVVVDPVVGFFKSAGSWLLAKGSALVSGFKSGVVSTARGIGSWVVSHVISPVRGVFSKAGTWLVEKGGALISGLKSGIVTRIKGIGAWIKTSVVDPVVNAVKHFFGIHSPSKVFEGIGGHLVAGLFKGLATTSGGAIARKVFGDMPSALGALVKKGLVSVSALPGKALKALGGLGGDVLGLLGLGGGGGGSSANQKIGATLAATRGWTGAQWAALKALWNGESGWNERALNKSSGAYGIPQSLPASKMASAGSDWKTNPATQIKWGLSYISSRYGSPLNAYSAWLARSPHWYAKGTRGAAKGLAWVGERGPELVNFKGGEDVLSSPQSMAFAKANGIKLPGYASGTVANAQAKVDQRRAELERARERHVGIKAAETRLAAAKQELANAKRRTRTTVENSITNGFRKTLATGTASAIASAIKSMVDKLQNAGLSKAFINSVLKQGEKLQALATKKATVTSRIAEAKQFAADQSSNIKDFLSISGTSATSVADLIAQMTGQQKTAGNLSALTTKLKARGASSELLGQLAAAGPGSQLAAVLGAPDVSTQDIAKLNKLMASGNKLADNFGRTIADTMFDSGKNASKGFLTGLISQEKDLEKAMAKLADSLIKSIKKKLKIKSPSRVFRDQVGKMVALGTAKGIDAHTPSVVTSAQRMAAAAAGVSTRRVVIPSSTGSGASAQNKEALELIAQAIKSGSLSGSEVHVHFNDDRLKDLIDVRVKPKIKASEDRQAFRAKVGRAATR